MNDDVKGLFYYADYDPAKDGNRLYPAFDGTSCANMGFYTACGVYYTSALRCGGAHGNNGIRMAVDAWFASVYGACCSNVEEVYGHISTWDTSGVTDMSELFCADSACSYQLWHIDRSSFNDDISAWDVSGVTTMRRMFREVASYDKPMNAWSVENVVDMSSMFYQASAFNQDLGWCVDDDVTLTDAFLNAPCASTSCGVTQGSCTRRNF